MIKGPGRFTLNSRGQFTPTGNYTAPRQVAVRRTAERADATTSIMPDSTNVRAFAKSNARLSAGMISDSQTELLTLAREIYQEDAVAGGVVEIYSGIPFGEFSLSGMPDSAALKPYTRSLDRLRIKSLLPTIATSYLVDGAHLSTLMFNDTQKVFDGIVPLDLMHARLQPVPFFGAAPVIDIQFSLDLQRAIASNDPRMQRYSQYIPDNMKNGRHLELAPENTLYIPRRTRADVMLGTSLFRRIMSVYLLDRSLMRGTIEMASRRQRGIIQLLMGDENWDPTLEEMREAVDLFQAADVDPVGAIVATRSGIQPQEVGGSEGAWKWSDSVDVLTQVKLKGLGMPDGLLGGDMSLDSVGSTLTVFIQQTRQFRDYITRAALYEKIFAYLAVVNNHRKDEMNYKEASSRDQGRLYDYRPELASDTEVELDDYVLPTVTWHNNMRPEGDRDYLEMLSTLEEKGVPIPIRMRAAAGGMNISDILNGQDEDLEMRKKLAAYQAQVAQLAGGEQQGGEEDNYNYGEASLLPQFPLKRIGLANRQYGDQLDPVNVINGKRYLATSRHKKQIHDKANKLIAESMASKAKILNRLPPKAVSLKPTNASKLGIF